MKMVRDLERRLERLMEGLAGRVFRGQLHPAELAARMLREADLAVVEGRFGPTVPNVYVLHVNPDDLEEGVLPEALQKELQTIMAEAAAERGWNLLGPVQVMMRLDADVMSGKVACRTGTQRGPLRPWATLTGAGDHHLVRSNRALLGRSEDCDVVLDEPHVSRIHAILWREGGTAWAQDLGSSNGTLVDGVAADQPRQVGEGSVISIGANSYSFRTTA